MAAATTLPALLASLTQSLSLAQEGTAKISAIEHQKDGISLLDVKNELLLSYLQNLVFLILVKLRNSRSGEDAATKGQTDVDDAVRAKLVELRLYLEKGARPLEEKLRFSIERFLRTAEDAKRQEKAKELKLNAKGGASSDESGSDEDEDEEESDEEDGTTRLPHRPGNLSAAPNLGTLVDDASARPAQREDGASGVYRPPRRERQVMETTHPREKAARRPMRSQTMDEFVAETAAAPMAEPSIGTTILQGGRKMKTAQDRKEEAERLEYEEMNFIRLPKESKKDRAQKAKQAGRSGRMQFGGEEWRDLGEGVDRIDRLTKRKEGGAGSGVRAMLEKSRKRGMDTTDGPRASGHQEMGERFNKKVKMLEAGRRDRGKGRR